MNKLLIPILATVLCVGCTANERARNFGGTETINIEPNYKVETVTWKQTDLWVLTRPMKKDEVAETLVFKEKSSFGMLEGKIILIESKK